jgi:F0F1-type ATP synthase assembly protein I
LRDPRWRAIGDAVEIGLAFPASTVGGYLLGKLGDWLFGTRPVLSFAGAFLGIVAAFVNLARAARRDSGEDEPPSR